MSTFTVFEAATRVEIDAVALLVQKANRTPYPPFVHVQTPYVADKPTATKLSQQWFWENHDHNTASHWITVHHSEISELVGAANWQVNKKNAFTTSPPKIETT
ncbi:hypothetical protein MFRU_005g03900 [Monilinia fructicola]|uniref:N-acetyltransferase domain-containing protein n=1 Tax=Monilinia fructicola TaxID=38448 RepID=A0A5M9JLE2_MONFR|nr:hypothetical protein EYC84_002611 [Monilinia fructicola]KAG4033382.1 hypothetical protein MFRU_005g03900 [Monilinia fructicola]